MDKNDSKKCTRLSDKKVFKLPRKYSKKYCLNTKSKAFSVKSSCAPYIDCKKKQKTNQSKSKQSFLYNPDDPKKSFDVYINKNPEDTISIKYKTVLDVKNTIKKLEKLYKSKKYTHKRIWQVAMIMRVRLGVILKHIDRYPNAIKINERYNLSDKYFEFLKVRTKKKERDRYDMIFNSKNFKI